MGIITLDIGHACCNEVKGNVDLTGEVKVQRLLNKGHMVTWYGHTVDCLPIGPCNLLVCPADQCGWCSSDQQGIIIIFQVRVGCLSSRHIDGIPVYDRMCEA